MKLFIFYNQVIDHLTFHLNKKYTAHQLNHSQNQQTMVQFFYSVLCSVHWFLDKVVQRRKKQRELL